MVETGVGADQWNRTTVETEWNWMIVNGLQSGTTYEVRVVAVTDSQHETRSRTRGVMIGSIPGINATLRNLAVYSVFYGRYNASKLAELKQQKISQNMQHISKIAAIS